MAGGSRTTFRGGLLLGVLLVSVAVTVSSAAKEKTTTTTTPAPAEEEAPPPAANATKKSSSSTGLPEGVNCVDGLMVPIWRPYENLSSGDRICRGLLYTLLMVYLFVGVSIVSDRFMESIEMITAQEKELCIKDRKTGKNTIVIVKVWNETVANLTLMALGSSAPEILLSVIEIWAKDFYAGDLGPGTIVGSAAFNLFMIIGLCMYVIPDDEVRKIKHLRVFIVTSTWSVFAYIWLYAILGPISYGVVEVWEGLLTFFFFPMCVYSAYVAEKRLFCYKYMHKSYRVDKRGVIVQSEKAEHMALRSQEKFKELDQDMDPTLMEFERHRREYINAMKRIRLENPDIDMGELEMRAREEVTSKGPKSRAYYRIQATRKLAGTKNLDRKMRDRLASDAKVEEGGKEGEETKKDDGVTRIYFDPPHYTVMENIGTFEATVVREGGDLNVGVQVDFKTEDGTAFAVNDYIEKAGTLYFPPGVTEQTITLEVLDDDVFEEDEHFYCRISNVRRKDGIAIHEVEVTDEAAGGETKKVPSIQLGTPHMATIMVLDDDHGGVFQFDTHELEITESVGVLEVKVNRQSGARGKVGIPFTTEEGTAKAGKDFEHVEGELIFNNEENLKVIEIPIMEEESYEKNVVMYCCIGEPRHISGPPGEHAGVNYEEIDAKDQDTLTEVEKIALLGRPRLGEVTKIQIRIKESKEFKSSVDRMMQRGNASMVMGASSWRDQFMEAFSVQAGDDDEEEEEGGEEGEEKMPTCGDYIMHFLTLFWKIIFAFIPPSGKHPLISVYSVSK
jgi:solute carrier family 8 (sodium/calcium exchanger)